MPYLDISGTEFTLPRFDDGHSAPINIPLGFPIGNDRLFEAFVSTKTHDQNTIIIIIIIINIVSLTKKILFTRSIIYLTKSV